MTVSETVRAALAHLLDENPCCECCDSCGSFDEAAIDVLQALAPLLAEDDRADIVREAIRRAPGERECRDTFAHRVAEALGVSS
jgi:hypothetical protein